MHLSKIAQNRIYDIVGDPFVVIFNTASDPRRLLLQISLTSLLISLCMVRVRPEICALVIWVLLVVDSFLVVGMTEGIPEGMDHGLIFV